MRGLPTLMTAHEVAEVFGVRDGTVWAWRRAGRIEAIRTPGGRIRFTEEAVMAARGSDDNGHAGRRGTEPRAADAAASEPPRYDHEHPCPAVCRPGVECCICADAEAQAAG